MLKKLKTQKGFTLIELLIVIAIIAIIAAVVFVALDPLSRFQEARNSTRWSEASSVLSALKIHQVDNAGTLSTAIDGTAASVQIIGTSDVACAAMTCTGLTVAATCANLTTDLVTGGYLSELPIDPTGGTTYTASATGYYANVDANGFLVVGSCGAEGTLTPSTLQLAQ